MVDRDGGPALRPKDETCRRLGEQFRRIREGKGVGLRPLAEAMGRTFFLIRRHEAGEMMLRTDDLFKAAEILGVRPSELLYIQRETNRG